MRMGNAKMEVSSRDSIQHQATCPANGKAAKAFHSSLLKPASDQLREYLASVETRVPNIPVINNVDVAMVAEPAAIKDALVRQAAGAVRWVECVQAMAGQGVTHVIECGPGKVLAGLTKRIDSNLVGASIVDPASLDEALKLVAA